jgi:hypothetical protein
MDNDINCQQLKKDFQEILAFRSKLSDDFTNASKDKDLAKVQASKEYLERKIIRLKEIIITPEKEFLKILNKPETWGNIERFIRGANPGWSGALTTYSYLEKLFKEYKSPGILTSRHYMNFLKMIDSEQVNAQIEKISKHTGKDSYIVKDVLSLIHALFLNLNPKKERSLEIDEYPESPALQMEFCVKDLTLSIKKSRDLLAAGLSNGTIFIEETGDAMCANRFSDEPVTIYAKKAGKYSGQHSHSDGLTILLDNIPEDEDFSANQAARNVYKYLPAINFYQNQELKLHENFLASSESFKNFFKENAGLFVVENSSVVPKNSLYEMEGGVLVFRDLVSLENIGKGMKGGIIILEDKNFNFEESAKKVSSERSGGFVFYRRFGKDPSDTELIEIK